MIRRLFVASLATLILASAADACFCKKRAQRAQVFYPERYTDTNSLTIQSVQWTPPPPTGTSNAVNGVIDSVPYNHVLQVTVYANYGAASTDSMELDVSPISSGSAIPEKTGMKKYGNPKVIPVVQESTTPTTPGTVVAAYLEFTIPIGDLKASSQYSLVAKDLTLGYKSSPVIMNTTATP